MIRGFWNKVKKLNDMINSHEIIIEHLNRIGFMESERYRYKLFSDRKYSDRKRLEGYGFKVYSQSDEDGIIQEIF